jgi:hypothetical protein
MAVLCLLTNTPLALVNASRGGKCKLCVKSGSKSQPKAGGSEYLEQHRAFPISLRAPGTLPERDSAEEIALVVA